MGQRFITISNTLSICRILLVIPFIFFITHLENPHYRLYALCVTIIGGLTDLLDGFVARKLNEVTEFGKIIDPIADKIAIGSVCIALSLLRIIPAWFVIAILLRDILIFSGGVYIKKKRGIVLQSNLFGKWTTVIVACYIIMTLGDFGNSFVIQSALLLSTMMLAVSFIIYCQRFLQYYHSKI